MMGCVGLLLACLIWEPQQFEGLPVEIQWADVNGDQREDLVAIVLRSKTIGSFTTYYQGGHLRGLYEDATEREFLLQSWLQSEDGFQALPIVELGDSFLNLALLGSRLFTLRDGVVLECFEFNTANPAGWVHQKNIQIPVQGVFSRHEMNWVWAREGKTLVLLPDLNGLFFVTLKRGSEKSDPPTFFLPYPESMTDIEQHGSSIEMVIPTPQLLDIDGDSELDLWFSSGTNRWLGLPIWNDTGELTSIKLIPYSLSGEIRDLDGDGLVDRLDMQANDSDVEGLKDLKNLSTHISVFRAKSSLQFPDQPEFEQDLPGLLIADGDDDFQLMAPFRDLNSDGRIDLATFGFKVSYMQVARVATTGKMSMSFLLELHVQEESGRFRTLPGGPLKMKWKMDLRNLSMPELGQLMADINGDGWMDVIMVSDSHLTLHPITESGFLDRKPFKFKLPKAFREADQVMGRDVDKDGRAEIMVVKLEGSRAKWIVLEVER